MNNSSHKVDIVIPNWNGSEWLPGCLKALTEQAFHDFKIILVDNGSTDDSLSFVRQNHPEAEIIEFKENKGFASAVNSGIKAGTAEYVALLNTDTKPTSKWLAELIAKMDSADEKVGSLASKMVNMDNPDIIDDAGDTFSWYGSATKRGHGQPSSALDTEVEVFSACAGAALYRRSFLEKLNGFDERFFAYLEDIDLGLRGQQAGYKCLYVPSAEVLHKGHGSSMPHGSYVRRITRNRMMIFAKNVPSSLMFKHMGQFILGQIYFFFAYRRPFHSIAGFFSFLKHRSHALDFKSKNTKEMVISKKELDCLLSGK